MPARFIRDFAALSAKDTALAGGKGASLGEMTRAGIPVPPGFVILSSAFNQFMQSAGLTELTADGLREKVLQATIPQVITDEILSAFQKLGAQKVAVRSSATMEDSTCASWAGQLETYLNTDEKKLLENVKKCWASLFLPRAVSYGQEKSSNPSVAVVVQKMVESEKSGIAFSVHPVTQNKQQLIIEAIFGLGEAIVSGSTNPDSYIVHKKDKIIIEKKLQGSSPVLSDTEIKTLAKIILKIEKHYGFPVDIEWAEESNKLYIIQSRPITTLGKKTEKNAAHIQALYQQYKTDMVYFNYPCLVLYACLTWYWLTDQARKYFGATVPFFLFFIQNGSGCLETPWYVGPGEKMLQKLEKAGSAWLKQDRKTIDQAEKKILRDLAINPIKNNKAINYYLKLLKNTVENFIKQHIHFQISTQIDRPLNKKLLEVFRAAGSTLSEQEIFALCVSSRTTDAVAHDTELEKLEAWCQKKLINLDTNNYEHNLGNKIFRQKLERCYAMGYFLRAGYGGVVLWTLRDEYQQLSSGSKMTPLKAPKPGPLNAEQKKYLALARHFSEVRDRRKSLQQHLFYRMAEILEEIGKTIGIPRTELECLRFEEFKKDLLQSSQVLALIEERKKGYAGFWDPIVKTWEWNGEDAKNVHQQIAQKYQTVNELQGTCACAGTARGRARIVLNPRLQEKFEEGEILVAGMTSPDYVPLMKKAAAVVTELGGITCHAAIISRELQKPCLIGTNIATKILKDGDLVEVDASHGTVKILKEE